MPSTFTLIVTQWWIGMREQIDMKLRSKTDGCSRKWKKAKRKVQAVKRFIPGIMQNSEEIYLGRPPGNHRLNGK